MPSREERHAEFVASLRAMASRTWVDFLYVDVRTSASRGGVLNEPASFSLVRSHAPASMAGVPISDVTALFACRMLASAAVTMLSSPDTTGQFVARNWRELLLEEPQVAKLTLMLNVEYPCLDGGATQLPMYIADAPPDVRVRSISPPGVWGGDSPDLLTDLLQQALALMPPQFDDNGDSATLNLDAHHVLFVTNLSLDTEGRPWADLSHGARWWPANRHPGRGEDWFSHVRNGVIGRPLGGVITVPCDQRATTVEARRQDADRAANLVRRFCTLLNVLHGPYAYLIARRTLLNRISGSTNEIREVYTGITYRHQSAPFARVPKLLTASEVALAAQLAFSSTTRANLLGLIQRATDSLTIARSLTDPPISHVLTWTAIEALISQKDETIANMTLCLLGLNIPVQDAATFWKRTKSSYDVRSSIVHGFNVPSPDEFAPAIEFAEDQASRLLRYACQAMNTPGSSRDDLVKELRNRFFSRCA